MTNILDKYVAFPNRMLVSSRIDGLLVKSDIWYDGAPILIPKLKMYLMYFDLRHRVPSVLNVGLYLVSSRSHDWYHFTPGSVRGREVIPLRSPPKLTTYSTFECKVLHFVYIKTPHAILMVRGIFPFVHQVLSFLHV